MKENNMRSVKTVKILTIVLAIMLISMISFFGIYKQDKNKMANTIKGYTYAMNLDGARNVTLKVKTGTSEVIKDSDGNVIESATEDEIKEKGYTKETIQDNNEEDLTEENYKRSKEIIEKRLKKLGVQNYSISVDKMSGDINLELEENNTTDTIIANLATVGKFEIIDSETKEVLLNNNDIKTSSVLYNNTSTGTSIYLEIAFNKEGKKKFEEITKTYVKNENTTNSNNVTDGENEVNTNNVTENNSTDAETTEKKITMKIDGEEIMTTAFDEQINTGKIQLSVGAAATDEKTLEGYINQANSMATVLDSGNMPIKYELNRNQYILSTINEQDLIKIAVIIAIVAIVGLVVLVIRYKFNGLLAAIAYIGFAALHLLLIRYANVTISIEAIFGIITVLILNYIFINILLKQIQEFTKVNKENSVNKATVETFMRFFIKIIPICIMVVAFCFIKWIPISSFGMIAFWGLTLLAVYNAIITRMLLKIKTEEK